MPVLPANAKIQMQTATSRKSEEIMSIWVYTKSKDGKQSLTSISVPYELILLSLGLIAGLIGPPLFSGAYPADFVRSAFFTCSGHHLLSRARPGRSFGGSDRARTSPDGYGPM